MITGLPPAAIRSLDSPLQAPCLEACRFTRQMTPLHACVCEGEGAAGVLTLLLERGASVVIPDENGLTALDTARMRNKKAAARIIREHIMAHPPPTKHVRMDNPPTRRLDTT
jgi:ankyrin repeat protein